MNKTIETAAAAFVAPKLLSGFKFRWLVYGAAAYFALRQMSKRGIFPKQADAALDVIDDGLDMVKAKVGLGSTAESAPSLHH